MSEERVKQKVNRKKIELPPHKEGVSGKEILEKLRKAADEGVFDDLVKEGGPETSSDDGDNQNDR